MENKILDLYNVCVGSVITLLTLIFGPHWEIFGAYFLLQVIDWGTGWYKSHRNGEESSKIGLIGIMKKLGYWALIAVAFLLADVFIELGKDLLHVNLNFLTLIGWFTLACLIINEARSIIENLVESGYKVPQILMSGLAVTQKLIDDKIPDEFVEELKNNNNELNKIEKGDELDE